MSSLDEIVGTPFVYLAKRSDPINLHAAVEYISSNESTNNIFVVHFVDDRHAIGVHHKIMRRVNAEVQEGKITAQQAASYNASLWKQMFQAGSPNSTVLQQASADGSMDMSLLRSLKSVSHETQQLVKTVALMDTFFT
jgi:hypothetical protein